MQEVWGTLLHKLGVHRGFAQGLRTMWWHCYFVLACKYISIVPGGANSEFAPFGPRPVGHLIQLLLATIIPVFHKTAKYDALVWMMSVNLVPLVGKLELLFFLAQRIQNHYLQHVIHPESDSVVLNTFNHDGSQIASGSGDKTIWIWDPDTKQLVWQYDLIASVSDNHGTLNQVLLCEQSKFRILRNLWRQDGKTLHDFFPSTPIP